MAFQSTPHVISAGEKFAKQATVVVDPRTGGDVQIQFRDSSGAWFTPSDPTYSITDKTVVTLTRTNAPETQIIATGDAQFEVTFDQ